MITRFFTICILILLVAFNLSCSDSETPNSNPQIRLIDLLQAAHPELYNDIAIQGGTPDDTVILFLVNKGTTYVFRRGTGQMPEVIHHAKVIAPNSITRITYTDKVFMLWSGDKLALTLGSYP